MFRSRLALTFPNALKREVCFDGHQLDLHTKNQPDKSILRSRYKTGSSDVHKSPYAFYNTWVVFSKHLISICC